MPAGHADAADGLPRHLEESMQTFISTLLQSLSERSHAELARLVATMVAQHVEAELTRRIRDEVSAQVSAAFPREDLNRAAKQAAEQQLPNVLSTRLGPLEQSLRQDLNEKATHLVEDLTAKLVRDLAGPAVQQQLPEVVRQQLGAMNGLVKEAAKEAATDYAKEAAERIVRQVADEQVSQLASVAVADVAEAQVKKELARLTAD